MSNGTGLHINEYGLSWDDVGLSNRKDGKTATPSDIQYAYFIWLCEFADLNGFMGNVERKPETDDMTYFMLAMKLHHMKFKPILPNDDNRGKDGLALRSRFSLISSAFNDYSAIDLPDVSMLEFFVALADRIDRDIMYGPSKELDRCKEWFWVMMYNCGFTDFTDLKWNEETDKFVDEKITSIIKRTYEYDGSGGIFPLKEPKEDQRNVEIWYQMQSFFYENYDELDLIGRDFGKPVE